MAVTSLVLLVAEMISSRDWNHKQFYVLIHLNDSNSLMILLMILLVFFREKECENGYSYYIYNTQNLEFQ